MKYLTTFFAHGLVCAAFVLLLAPAVAGATSHGLQNPFGSGGPTTLMEFIQIVITDVILPIASVVVVIAIIYTGFLFVAARGNAAKLETARTAFVWTVIGTAVLLGSWVIATAIEGTLCEITNNNIPGLCN
ncbi:MAG: hypothetical protein WD049_03710 [Candidatus Paceibacterota bacterium]